MAASEHDVRAGVGAGRTRGATAVAVDLGASSGRVLVGRFDQVDQLGGDEPAELVDLIEVARFANEPREVDGALRWDLDALWRGIGAGVRAAVLEHGATSMGIDSWAVDYGLVDANGGLVAAPVCYRDDRTQGVLERVEPLLSRDEHYRITGLQYQPFNSVYQLLAETAGTLEQAAQMLLMPDLLSYKMTGVLGAERTNASTTGLYDVRTGDWSTEIMHRLGLPERLLAPIVEPGSSAGRVRSDVLQAWGLPTDTELEVVRVGSHDTASAVLAVPAEDAEFAYVSCGTWSLVGLECDEPVLTNASSAANFTNEVGVDSTIRFLRNVTGLWLLSESLREWPGLTRDEVVAQAAQLPTGRWLVDAESAEFLAPGDMPARIAAAAARHGEAPVGPAETARCIIDSLAAAHARNVELASRLAGRIVRTVHVVGGGSANELLCQATADACGLPVVAGPVEATAIGNLLVQGRAAGRHPAGAQGRARARVSVRVSQVRRFEPRSAARILG